MLIKIFSFFSLCGAVIIGSGIMAILKMGFDERVFLSLIQSHHVAIISTLLVFILSVVLSTMLVLLSDKFEEECHENKKKPCCDKEKVDYEGKLKELEAQLKALSDSKKTSESPDSKSQKQAGSPEIPPVVYQILYLLQKDGRLLDFLTEEISQYSDEEIGSAFRPKHADLKKLFSERFVLKHILDESENITIEKIDPDQIKLIAQGGGGVPANGPYKGRVVHRGWQLVECRLPELVSGWNSKVVAPAEVEIN
ncbi:MAG: DUF2760 domain-containing protein [Candidatus Riflebacteria bacterium]|nr:DUF2760 domain-containing protein [Candidatus Riflebacteria bacterium]